MFGRGIGRFGNVVGQWKDAECTVEPECSVFATTLIRRFRKPRSLH